MDTDGCWLHVGSIVHPFPCFWHHSGVAYSSIDFALFLDWCLMSFGDLADNFLRKPNSSKNTSHDSQKAGGVTPWRKRLIQSLEVITYGVSRRDRICQLMTRNADNYNFPHRSHPVSGEERRGAARRMANAVVNRALQPLSLYINKD